MQSTTWQSKQKCGRWPNTSLLRMPPVCCSSDSSPIIEFEDDDAASPLLVEWSGAPSEVGGEVVMKYLSSTNILLGPIEPNVAGELKFS